MGLSRRIERVTLDVSNDYNGAPLWAVQGEANSLELDVELSQAGKLIDLSDTQTTFKFCTPHGYIGVIRMGEDGCFAKEELGHLGVHVPIEAFSEDGICQCAISVFDQVAGIMVKTPPFQIHVLQSL